MIYSFIEVVSFALCMILGIGYSLNFYSETNIRLKVFYFVIMMVLLSACGIIATV